MVKIFIPLTLIALALLCDFHLFNKYVRVESVWRWAWWLPSAVVIGFIVKFMFFHHGLVAEYSTTNIFLLLMLLFCVPKMLYAAFSFIPKVGPYIGGTLAIGVVYIIIYGITYGFMQQKVTHVTYEDESVPEAFDGYRIAVFSDTHTGVFRGPYWDLLKESLDTLNSYNPDLICFVGDIENFSPEELEPHKEAYSSLKAKDGVFAIMGNHDYSTYIKQTDRQRAMMVKRTREMQREFGWTLLEDENRTIHRGSDSIVVMGEENWGLPPFPQYGNIKKTIKGVKPEHFKIMLSHDPNAWRAHILPLIRPNITFSGHTHGTQFSLFGWSPASSIYREWGGRFDDKEAMIYTSTGLGGNFPFRFGMPREIVIVTLKKKK